MKSRTSTLFILVFVVCQLSISLFAEQKKDTTQVRYVKFESTLSADYTRLALQEIKVFCDGVNIAQDQSIRASSNTYDYNVSRVIDGDEISGWFSDDFISLTSDGGYGPTANNPHYIIVDLGSKYNLESLKLNNNAMGFDYTFDFLVSEDATTWSLVDSKTQTHGEYTYTTLPIQNVRYIKYACYYSTDYGQVNVQEIQAYYNGVNVALNKSVSANSYEYGDATSNGKNVVDGSSGTRWSSNRNDHISATSPTTAPVEVTVDMGKVQTVDSLQLIYGSATVFKISVSADGTEWLKIDQRLNDKNKYSYVLNRSIRISSVITSNTSTTATCKSTITFNGGSDIIDRGVCWSTSPKPTISDSKISNGTGLGSFVTTLTELLGKNVYYVRAYAINADTIKYSNQLTIITGLSVRTNVITDLTYSTATSGGYIQAVNDIEITERGVCWSTSPVPTIANDRTYDGTGTGEFTSNLIGLTGGTKYYVRMYVTTNLGTFYGNELSFKYKNTQYQANYDGWFGGEIYTETGTMNDQKYFSGSYGGDLYFDGNVWILGGYVTTEEAGNPPLNGWWEGTGLSLITTIQLATVTLDKNSLTESIFDDGSFKQTISINHDNTNGAAFTGLNAENFIETGKAAVTNLPAGLTANVIRNSNLSLTLSLIGNATAHDKANDLSNVKVLLYPAAFTDGEVQLTNGNLTDLTLHFIEPTNITVTDIKTSADYSITADNNVTLASTSDFTINSNTELNKLVVNPGATLTVSNLVTVNNVILKADDSNSCNVTINAPTIVVNGSVIYQKTMTDNKVYYLAFPCDVNVQDISMMGGGSLGADWYLHSYNCDKKAKEGSAANWDAVSCPVLLANKGYAFCLKAGSGPKTLAFVLPTSVLEQQHETAVSAEFYDGNVGVHHTGWNFIGQPYLHPTSGTNIGLKYITTWDGSAYKGQLSIAVTNLQPFEAFMVQVASTRTVPFYLLNKLRSQALTNYSIQSSIQLNMSNTAGSDATTLLVDNSYSTDYLIGQDLEKWISTTTDKPQVYSTLNGVNYAFNALTFGDITDLPLAYYSKLGGQSTISATSQNLSDLSQLLLTDTKNSVTTDLLTSSYNFDADAGTTATRFVLTARRMATELNAQHSSTPIVYVQQANIQLQYLPTNATVSVCDITGKMLYSKTSTTDKLSIPISSGVYVVRISNLSNVWTYKVLNNK